MDFMCKIKNEKRYNLYKSNFNYNFKGRTSSILNDIKKSQYTNNELFPFEKLLSIIVKNKVNPKDNGLNSSVAINNVECETKTKSFDNFVIVKTKNKELENNYIEDEWIKL